MIIEKITVRLGRTIPGPEYGGGQFANVKPEIELTVIPDATVSTPEQLAQVMEQATRAAQAQLKNVEAALIRQALGQPEMNNGTGGVRPAVQPMNQNAQQGSPLPLPPQPVQPAAPQQVNIPQVSQPTW